MASRSKEELVAELAARRVNLKQQAEVVRIGLSPGHQLKSSIQRHPRRWAALSAGAAFLAMHLLRRKKIIYQDVRKKGGLVSRSTSLAFRLARPALTTLALNQLQRLAEEKFGGSLPIDDSMLGGPPQK